MFTIKQTRIILVLTVIITVLISIIGLNLQKKEETKFEMKARLEVPDIASDWSAKKQEEVPVIKEEFKGALEDEGKTISLE
jgi:hypothetical protein